MAFLAFRVEHRLYLGVSFNHEVLTNSSTREAGADGSEFDMSRALSPRSSMEDVTKQRGIQWEADSEMFAVQRIPGLSCTGTQDT